jgi:hypothetical protein
MSDKTKQYWNVKTHIRNTSQINLPFLKLLRIETDKRTWQICTAHFYSISLQMHKKNSMKMHVSTKTKKHQKMTKTTARAIAAAGATMPK